MIDIEKLNNLIDERGEIHQVFEQLDNIAEYFQDKSNYYQLRQEYISGLDSLNKTTWFERLKTFIHAEQAVILAAGENENAISAQKNYIIPKEKYNIEFKPNQRLKNTILGLDNVEIKMAVEKYKKSDKKTPMAQKELFLKIYSLFPAPIGDKLLRLGSLEIMSENNVKNEEEENDILGHRIEYCCDLYTTIIQLTTSVYLSQLWNCVKNEKVAEKKFCQLNEKTTKQILSYIHLDKKDAKNFSFFQLIKAVKSVIELNGEKPFLQEQNGTEKMKITDIENAVSFFQEVLLRDEEGISKEDYLSIALQCETHICQLITFSKGFLDYRLLSIREIHLKKMRFAAPHFSHIQAILNFENETEHHFIEYPVDDDFSSNKAHFVEDSSIVLAKSQKDFSIYLNLTPFLIDKSNIEDKSNSDIFYFAYEEKDILAFKSIQEIDEKSFDISKKDDIENINVLEQDDAETAARDKSKEIVNLIATFKADIINAFSKPNPNKNN